MDVHSYPNKKLEHIRIKYRLVGFGHWIKQ